MIRQASLLKKYLRKDYLIPILGLGLFVCTMGWMALPSSPITASAAYAVVANPAVLSDADLASYKTIFAAQKDGDIEAADLAMAQLNNDRLVGYVLAERYLNTKHAASKEELSAWLANYSDHPQMPQIAKLAASKGVSVAALEKEKPLKGDGYTDHIGRSTMPDSWYRGLALWREQNYSAALPLFVAIGNNEDGSDWQRSAGYYWAYRAASKVDQNDVAEKNLALATNFNTTFYGLLALQQTNGSFTMKAHAPSVSARLRNNPSAIRAGLLAQLDRGDDAEEEVRLLYSRLSVNDRAGLVTLAHEMDLPNLQVRLARIPQLSEAEAIYARYPVPEFMAEQKADLNPALILAIVRNESTFLEKAASGAGAVGFMQMLPSTAQSIERRIGRDVLSVASADNASLGMRERLRDPATSVRFGAEYVKILMGEPAVGRNLMRVLAAYNAGPGTVSGWNAASRQINDPLLYMESIPYPETHNYVMQVMAQYWIYQSLLGEKPTTLVQLSEGKWPELAPAL